MADKNFTIGVLSAYIDGLIRGNTPIRDEYEKGYVDACERIAEVIRENFTALPSDEFKPVPFSVPCSTQQLIQAKLELGPNGCYPDPSDL